MSLSPCKFCGRMVMWVNDNGFDVPVETPSKTPRVYEFAGTYDAGRSGNPNVESKGSNEFAVDHRDICPKRGEVNG